MTYPYFHRTAWHGYINHSGVVSGVITFWVLIMKYSDSGRLYKVSFVSLPVCLLISKKLRTNRESGSVILSNYSEGEIQLSSRVVRINTSAAAAVSQLRRTRGKQADTPGWLMTRPLCLLDGTPSSMRGLGNCKLDNWRGQDVIFCLSSYYINHYTKTTTWEDPRERYQQIGKGSLKVVNLSVRSEI